MPHPLPLLAAIAAMPLLGIAMRAAPAQADARPAAMLPNNLCASCHGGGRAAVAGREELEASDVMAARAYLRGSPRG